MKRNRGFTLMEMLIVVAIIAVLAAVAIPVFNGSLHKAKVAADMANVRAYYAELQTQYITTGEYIDIGDDMHLNWRREIKFLDSADAGWHGKCDTGEGAYRPDQRAEGRAHWLSGLLYLRQGRPRTAAGIMMKKETA